MNGQLYKGKIVNIKYHHDYVSGHDDPPKITIKTEDGGYHNWALCDIEIKLEDNGSEIIYGYQGKKIVENGPSLTPKNVLLVFIMIVIYILSKLNL